MSASPYRSQVPALDGDDARFPQAELVRAAEASRLRRRGTMAPTHPRSSNPDAQTQWITAPRPPLGPAQLVLPPLPPSSAPQTSPDPTPMPAAYPPWDDLPKTDDADDVGPAGYTLFCGYEDWDFGDPTPYQLSPLPEYPPRLAPRRQPVRRSTGCGALIHTNGTPRTRCGSWQAKGPATHVVVPLEKQYFDRGGHAKHFTCGCRWHGVGCSVCGNALGNVYIPCPAAASPPSSPTPPPMRTPPTANYLYTFFCTATSSAPAFIFPESCAVAPPPHALPSFSSSPEPVEDPLAEGSMSNTRPQYAPLEPTAALDPDGVYISQAPNSPDKPASEPMLWPAR